MSISDIFINILKNYKYMFLLREDKKETAHVQNNKKMIAVKSLHMEEKAAINESLLFFG